MLDGWSDWVQFNNPDAGLHMPGQPDGIPLLGNALTVMRNYVGCLHVFCIGSDGNLWHIQQTSPNGTWGGWTMIGNPGNVTLVAPIVVVMNANGRLEAFCMTNQGQILHAWESATPTQTASSPPWSPLSPMPQLQGVQIGVIAAVANGNDQHLEVFVAGTNASPQGPGIYHCYQTTPNNGWIADFALLQGNLFVNAIAAAVNYGGTAELFILGGQNATKAVYLSHLWQTKPGAGPWSGLVTLDSHFPNGNVPSAPCAGMTCTGALEVFAVDEAGQLWQSTQGGGGSPDGWTPWSNVGQLAKCVQSYGTPVLLARSYIDPGQIITHPLTHVPPELQMIFALHLGNGNLIDGVQFEVGTSSQPPTSDPPSAVLWPGAQFFLGGGQASCLAVGINQDSRSEVFILVAGSLWHAWMLPTNDWVTGKNVPF